MGMAAAALLASRCAAQTAAPATKASKSAEADTKKKNLDAYIALMRRDVRQEKAEIMGSMMALSAQDSAKFWPIYSEYDTELAKMNDQRVQNIKDYVQSYNEMTDEKADQLMRNAVAYQRQRAELVARTYEKVKQTLGGIEAARFAMVEGQLLAIIDLQVVSSLPLVGSSN
jgi:glutamyl/glutaminyl-tRNA synthetase